ncbi:hypothetical protein [Nonomuraea phyllanthi]|nr:hypothetical protein [Nonomuraea phyllanthi]
MLQSAGDQLGIVPMRTVARTTRRKPSAVACAAALGMFLLSACAAAVPSSPVRVAHHHGTHVSPDAAGQVLPTAGMEQIAGTLGCPSIDMQVDATELRQAVCRTSRGRYTLVTFTTDAGKRMWLDAAQAYGGTYLVGDRWVVIATPALLEALREQLGGRIESMRH